MKQASSHIERRPGARRQHGFSLFELVVFILSVAIIYAYAAQRFASYPGEAEKANFIAVTTQLQNSMTLQTFTAQLNGSTTAAVAAMENGNPMELMLRPPRNYFGESGRTGAADLPRRSWYFDSANGHLVYLVGAREAVYLIESGRRVPTDEIRLQIVADYSEIDRATGLPMAVAERNQLSSDRSDSKVNFNGLILAPVAPYRWGVAGDSAPLLLAAARR